jgi:hypothetical protein
MFANIRRHQKWLWYLIAGAVIISFTWYLNPSNRQGMGGGRNSQVGTINGRPITRTEYFDAQKEALLQYFLRNGTWYGSDDFSRQDTDYLTRETRNRLFLHDKIREYNIHVTTDEVEHAIREAFGRERPFTVADYERFLKERLEPHGVKERDFERFIKTDVAISHLANVAGVPGRLVTPQEAEAQYRRDYEQTEAQIVSFSQTNYLSKVVVDPIALATYYTNQAAQYREPEKIQIAYVDFPASNYFALADQTLAKNTNLNQTIEGLYASRGEKFFTDTNGAQMTPDAAKAKIRSEIRNANALVEAQKVATDFAEGLLTNKTLAHFEEMAKQRGLTVKTSQPFTQYEGPAGLDLPERFSQLAFALTATEPFIEEPIKGDDAVYVIGLKNRIASHIPPYDQVRKKVDEDYKHEQAQKLMFDDAQAFHMKLTNSMAAGKKFADASAEHGQKAITLEPFSRNSRTINGLDSRIDPGMIKSAAASLKPGETSGFRPARDGGFILHVEKTIPVADHVLKSALPEYLKGLQLSGQSEAFQEWFAKESQAARISLITDKSESETVPKTK